MGRPFITKDLASPPSRIYTHTHQSIKDASMCISSVRGNGRTLNYENKLEPSAVGLMRRTIFRTEWRLWYMFKTKNVGISITLYIHVRQRITIGWPNKVVSGVTAPMYHGDMVELNPVGKPTRRLNGPQCGLTSWHGFLEPAFFSWRKKRNVRIKRRVFEIEAIDAYDTAGCEANGLY